MNIIIASDDNGVDLMLVAVYSIIKNNLKSQIRFHILHSNISLKNQKRVRNLESVYPNSTIKFVTVDEKMFKGIELTNEAVSLPAYYRYLAPTILKSEHKALYVDIDILCLGNLKEVYSTNLGGYIMGAVEDYFISRTEDYPGFRQGIGLSLEDRYVNTGVLLMNLDEMRKTTVMDGFWDKIRHKSEIIPAPFNIFADQTIANLAFKKKIKILDNKYNALTTAMKYTNPSEVVIVHFAGPDKPFTYRDNYSAKYNDIYYDYYEECMNIAGGDGHMMIKKTIKRLGEEATRAISSLSDIEHVARDKTNHVVELSSELRANSKELEATRIELKEKSELLEKLLNSKSWKITKPFRVVSKLIKAVTSGIHGH